MAVIYLFYLFMKKTFYKLDFRVFELLILPRNFSLLFRHTGHFKVLLSFNHSLNDTGLLIKGTHNDF